MKQDILIIMPDQLRADCIGAMGNSKIKTSNIDSIAEEGILFKNTYTTTPICMPARASFVSGIYPHNHNMWDNRGQLPSDDETFFHHLQRAGYYVSYIGKSHFYEHKKGIHMKNREEYMKRRGINYVHETTGPHATVFTDSYLTDYLKKKNILDVFRDDYKRRNHYSVHPSPLPEEDYLDSYVGRKAVEFIKNYKEKKPLCLFVGFPGPHEPWDPPGEYGRMYNPEDMPDEIENEKIPDWLPERVKERMKREREPFKELSPQITRKIRAMYYGKISLIDFWVGEILEEYKKNRDFDNLIIIFWSDHGEMLGDHNMLYKSVFYEQSIKVPLIIRWPGKNEKIKNENELVEIIDVFPTLLDGLGLPLSERATGESLFKEKSNKFVISEIYAYDTFNYMIRTKDYKFSINRKGEGLYLFDLKKDPDEKVNLIGNDRYEEIEKELKELIFRKIVNSQVRIR